MVAKPLCPLYKNIIKPLDRARYPELRYFFGVNAAHIVEWSWYTTNDMIDSCFTIMVVTAMFYIYGFFDMFINRTKLGRKICA